MSSATTSRQIREARGIAIGVERQAGALVAKPSREACQDRLAPTAIKALSTPPSRRACPPAR